MTNAMQRYVNTAETLANRSGLVWNPPHGFTGEIDAEARWNLNALAGLPPRRTLYMKDFGWNTDDLFVLYDLQNEREARLVFRPSMDSAWCELYQASVISTILIERHTPDTASRIGRAIKLLAMCSVGIEPDQVTGTGIQLGYNVALRASGGSVAKDYLSVVRRIFDGLNLAVRPNLHAQCTAYPDARSQAAARKLADLRARDARVGKAPITKKILAELHERKSELRLPDTRAFWEFCRIAFTETPRSVLDLELFAAARVHVITGLRSGEVSLLPLDWERWHEWTDLEGQPAGKRGGISRSLSIRHFAFKQARDEGAEGIVLTPRMQHVPEMFEDIVLESLHEVERVTRPMRKTAKLQKKTGRYLPDLDPGALIPAWEAYIRLVGDIRVSSTSIPDDMIHNYIHGVSKSGKDAVRFAPALLKEVYKHQLAAIASPIQPVSEQNRRWFATNLHENVLSYLRYTSRRGHLIPRNISGEPLGAVLLTKQWSTARFLVSDIEAFLAREVDTRRMPDRAPFKISDGSVLHVQDMLFLKAKCTRNVPETDVVRYFGVGRFVESELQKNIGEIRRDQHKGLFSRYGATEEDRALTLNTHAMRHLQNTELFRLGLSDAIITKRFNRTSVAQSYVYDHRSLQEHLEDIALPEEVEATLGTRAAGTYKLILSGRASGPLVTEFLRIQREQGDDVAFAYLAVEADGLHATPYGFCVNSFTVDPCPNNIECYNGCRHLARSDLPDEQKRLEDLRDRMETIVTKVEAEPIGRVGRTNQLRHARVRLENIKTALDTAPRGRPFPDGPDLYRSFDEKAGTSVLDGAGALTGAKPVGDAPSARRPALDMDDA